MNLLLILTPLMGAIAYYALRQLSTEKSGKEKKLKAVQAFNRLVLQNRLSIDRCEMIGDRILALDERNKTLLFVDYNGKINHTYVIPLRLVVKASVREEKNVNGNIEKIVLELKGEEDTLVYRLNFFDHACDAVPDLLPLSRKALHWKSRIDMHRRPGKFSLEQEYML